MLNKIPFFGWILTAIAAIGLAVPFWLCWTIGGIGATFFGAWLPAQFVAPGFWQIFGLFICLGIFKWILSCITPRFAVVSVSNDSTSKSKNQNASVKAQNPA